MGAGLPAGALNVLTGSDVSLGAKVAQNLSISYVTYSGNKQVCERETWCYISNRRVENPFIHVFIKPLVL